MSRNTLFSLLDGQQHSFATQGSTSRTAAEFGQLAFIDLMVTKQRPTVFSTVVSAELWRTPCPFREELFNSVVDDQLTFYPGSMRIWWLPLARPE
jgi:hypothetical protein